MTKNTFINELLYDCEHNGLVQIQTDIDRISYQFDSSYNYRVDVIYNKKKSYLSNFDRIEIIDDKVMFINNLTDKMVELYLLNLNKIISFRRLMRE